MTQIRMPDTSVDMARIKQYEDAVRIRFPEGTFDGIKLVLRDGEDRSDFIREAIEQHIKSRKLNAQGVAGVSDIQIGKEITQPRKALDRAQAALEAAQTRLERVLPLHVENLKRAAKTQK